MDTVSNFIFYFINSHRFTIRGSQNMDLEIYWGKLIIEKMGPLIERWVFWSFWIVGEFNMTYSFRDMETFEISSYEAPQKTKKAIHGYFRLSEDYTHLRTSTVNPFLWSFWRVNQLCGKWCNFVITRPPKNKKIYFRELPVVWRTCMSQTTYSKLILAFF